MKKIIGVMGPGESATSSDCKLAYELGKLIAKENFVLLTGGRNKGVMDEASRGAKDNGGLTIGIIPTTDTSSMSDAIDIPIITGMGSARNNINILSAHAILVCGMGSGTASEVALALKAKKDVVFLNQSESAIKFFTEIGKEKVHFAENPN